MNSFKFGDKVENPDASPDNPIAVGYFVETIRRRGKLNPGKWARLTDRKGWFWEVKYDALVACE